MAATFALVKKGVMGNMRVNVVDITLDTTYATGGYAVTAANLGLGTILAVQPHMKTTEGVRPAFDYANSKLMMFKTGNTTTVTSGNGDYKELATNDTLVTASTVIRAICYGDAVSG